MTHLEILRRAFATFDKRQKRNVLHNLDQGVRVLCGGEAMWYVHRGGA